MKYYLAPLEGITTRVFRNAYHACFSPMDKYFTPFLVPHSKRGLSVKEKKEILPENNRGMYLVPQIMSNQAEDCLDTIRKLTEYGYREINLNLGCPSRIVVAKGRGAGILADPENLNRFLYEVFEGAQKKAVRISMKTRLGMYEADEFCELLAVYNQYPAEELIIHPRVQTDYYRNVPNWEMFRYAISHSRNPVVYNGDIFGVRDQLELEHAFPEVDTVMIGRGILKNPFLLKEIQEDREALKREPSEHVGAKGMSAWENAGNRKLLKRFLDQILQGYLELGLEARSAMFKMKELWSYLLPSLPEHAEVVQKILKAKDLEEYTEIVNVFLYNGK